MSEAEALLAEAGQTHARYSALLADAGENAFHPRVLALLDDIHLALIAADRAALKRRSGFWGRLWGKDIDLADEARALRAQAPLLQYRAEELARDWDSRTRQHAAMQAAMQHQQHALQAALAGEEAAPMRHRLQQLLSLFATGLAHIAIHQQQEHALRQHFDAIRTTLLPLLAQRSALEHARQNRHLLDAARERFAHPAPLPTCPATAPDRSLP